MFKTSILDIDGERQDLVSYKKEVEAGDASYNLITVIMAKEKTDLQGAVDAIGAMCERACKNFVATAEDVLQHKNGIPSWGAEIDRQVSLFVDALGTLCYIHATRRGDSPDTRALREGHR